MKKRKTLFVCLTLIIVSIAAIMASYLFLQLYYDDKFIFGTWINGQYCTGRTVEEVNGLLLEDAEYPTVTITDLSGNTEIIQTNEAMCSLDYSVKLETMLKKQESFGWLFCLLTGINKEISPDIVYNNDILVTQIEKLNIITEARNVEELKAEIIRTEDGYVLEHNMFPVPNEEKITNAILTALNVAECDVVLTEDCYDDRTPTEEMEETIALWDKVEALQSCGIVYDMGDTQVPIDAAVVADWIATDDSGRILTDESNEIVLEKDCFKAFINDLAEEFDTYNVPREFQTTRGDVVTIEKGTYGNRLDKKTEIAYLKKAFTEGGSEIHTPAYTKEALYKGKDDIGDTYIEIDLTGQIMYYYEKGELIVETPIVSGNVRSGHKTPERVCYVYNKQTDRILRGPGYASHVDYWMPISGAIGIHDADWRNKFGGEIYKTNGSHGCINTPYDEMVTLFERVEIGTPVIMFY